MTRFLVGRLLNYVVLLAVASFLVFALASLEFKPLDNLLQRNPRPPQAVIDAKAAELNLDKPIPVRYGDWVAGAVRGDFGTTIGGQPIAGRVVAAGRRHPAAPGHRHRSWAQPSASWSARGVRSGSTTCRIA